MAKERINIQALQGELEQALKLIRERSTTEEAKLSARPVPCLSSLANSDSLLERCADIVKTSDFGKPTLRVVRHLACSGGTLLSKCLAAMPNVYLLSELHPQTTLHMGGGKAKFLPADVATQARYAGVPDVQALADEIFVASVVCAHKHVTDRGGDLVVRAHSHSDYCVGPGLSVGCAVSRLLSEHFNIQSVATIRNPIDAYLSLIKNDWVHFEPRCFDEYCCRAIAFIEDQNLIFSYERFVLDPVGQMKAITSSLGLGYDDSFIDTFGAFNVTGDSGRSGDVIAHRPRQKIPNGLEEEVRTSRAYQQLLKLLKAKALMEG